MEHEQDQPTTIGLMTWLSEQFAQIQHALGHLQAGQITSRRMAHQSRQELLRRMERIEQATSRNRFGWMKNFPWVKVALVVLTGLLLITGHLTVAELKAALLRSLMPSLP